MLCEALERLEIRQLEKQLDVCKLENMYRDIIDLENEVKQLKKQLHEHTATEQKITVGCVVNYSTTYAGLLPRLIIKTWEGFYIAVSVKTGYAVTLRRDSVEELVKHYHYKFAAASLKEYYASQTTV